jgi:hypothetical protein
MRVVMCNAYADLHMRNGDVVPMFLQGQQMSPGDSTDDLVDMYLEQFIEPIFTGVHVRQDNGLKHYHGSVLDAGDFSTDSQTGEKRHVHRLVRRAHVCYATLRFDITEEEFAV